MTIGDAPFPLLQMPRVGGFAPPAEFTRARDSPAAGGMYRLRIPAGDLAWVVTRYDDVREVLGDPDRFSSAPRPDPRDAQAPVDEQAAAAAAERQAGSLLTTDPPEHNRLRRMVAGEFTVRRIRDLTPRIVEIVHDHLDAMVAAGPPTDLVRDFAVPIPSLVISELLGVPPADRAAFQDRARRQLDTLSTAERERVATEARAYMGELVDRAHADRGDDILGMLVARHGDELTRAELVGIADLLLFAGHETTATMLAFGTLALLRHPDQRDLVRDDPGAIGAAVEELLRFLSVTQTTPPRTATRDTVLGGHRISAGDILLLSLPAANRDPRFATGRAGADVLDMSRAPAPHLAFGYGVHHCLGAALARQEMTVAFPALLRRFPRLALDVAFDDVAYRANAVFYGPSTLPVTW